MSTEDERAVATYLGTSVSTGGVEQQDRLLFDAVSLLDSERACTKENVLHVVSVIGKEYGLMAGRSVRMVELSAASILMSIIKTLDVEELDLSQFIDFPKERINNENTFWLNLSKNPVFVQSAAEIFIHAKNAALE